MSLRHALVLVVFLAACKKDDATAPSGPSTLIVVQGENQAVQGGKELPVPVVMRIVDADGNPKDGVPISFVIAAGGGSVTPGTITSDDNGEAKTKWTVGPNAPEQQLQVNAPGANPVTISAVAIVPAEIVIAQGNNQTARVGIQLANSIVIRVVGSANTPMSGIPVAFQITAGGGVITPQSAITNALGEVTVKWTMGSVAGANTLTVHVGSLTPVVLTATATP